MRASKKQTNLNSRPASFFFLSYVFTSIIWKIRNLKGSKGGIIKPNGVNTSIIWYYHHLNDQMLMILIPSSILIPWWYDPMYVYPMMILVPSSKSQKRMGLSSIWIPRGERLKPRSQGGWMVGTWWMKYHGGWMSHLHTNGDCKGQMVYPPGN